LTAARLRESLAFAGDPKVVAQARAIGEAMAGEGGVADAVNRIVRALERRRV
jgi:carbamoylphosphate synthase large subunit